MTLKLFTRLLKGIQVLLLLMVIVAPALTITLPKGTFFDIGNPHYSVSSHGDLSTSLNQMLSETLNARFENESPVVLKVDKVKMSTEVTPRWKFWISVYLLLAGITVLIVLEYMFRIVRSIGQDKAFSKENIARLKVIGIISIGGAVAEWVLSQVVSFWMSSSYHIDGLVLEWDQYLGWPAIIFGLLILAFTDAFKRGVAIKEENELMI